MKNTYSQLIDEHREWLKGFDGERVNKWNNLLNNNPEAALCEASTRKSLSDFGCDVEPFEDLSTGGVDFKCSKDGSTFYVEATCITKEAATDKSGLTDKAQHYAPLTKTIWQELKNKTPQCSGLDAPCIVAIGTFHFQAGYHCFGKHFIEELLTGTPHITRQFDTELGEAIGETYESTDLESAAFLKPSP